MGVGIGGQGGAMYTLPWNFIYGTAIVDHRGLVVLGGKASDSDA